MSEGSGTDPLTRRTLREHELLAAAEGADGPTDHGFDVEPTEDEVQAARAKREARRRKPKSPTRNLVEWVVVIGGALVLALLVRTFAFQTFWIPSGSMEPTLQVNDRVLVNKLSYRFGDISRGDVIVFERPPGEAGQIEDLIKRVIALPGEHISIRDGSVFIDGRLLHEPYLEPGVETVMNECGIATNDGIRLTEGMLIPEGQIFVLGDNRGGSHDGRCFGPISTDLVVGRAVAIIWPPSRIGGL